MSRPFVSVLIDTCNHEKFIEQAITSVLEQSFSPSDCEIFVVDDGSTDRTPEIVKEFAPRVTHLRKQNGGQASAFNFGLPHCRGEIVAFLDGDDWWERKKMATVLSIFGSHPEIGAVGHGIFEVDEQGKQLYENTPDRTYSCSFRSLSEAQQFLTLRSFLGTSRFTIRKSVVDSILPLPEKLLVEADEFLFTMAVALSGCIVLDRPLTSYRYHSGNQFQFSAGDDRRRERRFVSLDCLARELPLRLRSAGVPREIVEFLTLPNWIDATRSRLALGRGWPWETVRVERRAFLKDRKDASLAYRLFHFGVLAVATVLPPRLFYSGRDWYAARGLAKVRGYLAEEPAVDSLTVRKARNS